MPPVSPPIPLMRASFCEPIIIAAQKIGTPIYKLLNHCGLPTMVLDDPHMLVPEIPAWNLLEDIAKMEAEPLFGLKAMTELAMPDISTIAPLTHGYTNLKLMLENLCRVAITQSNV